MTIKLHTYDTADWPFREAVELLLGTQNLEGLHRMGGVPKTIVAAGSDNHSIWHNKFYSGFTSSGFLDIYHDFLRTFIKPIFRENIVAQNKPTFRIHWVNNLSVGAFHRDSEYNHDPSEINFWLPVTQAYDTNSIWLESERDKADYSAQSVTWGQVLEFPGGELMHGNKINTTIQTRISFDFRVIPVSKYKEPTEIKSGCGHGKLRFIIGEYYEVF